MASNNVSVAEAVIQMILFIVIFIGCLSVGIFYVYQYFFGEKREEMHKLSQYFRANTVGNLVFNILCALLCTMYAVWIVADPLSPDTLYFEHASHNLRVPLTVIWYIAKIFPFLIFNGRLKFAFTRGVYGTSTALFWTLNAVVVILTIVSLVLGHLGIFVFPNPYLAWIGFNLYRIMYIVLLLLLSWMFNKRIILIISKRMKWGNYDIVRQSTGTDTCAQTQTQAHSNSHDAESIAMETNSMHVDGHAVDHNQHSAADRESGQEFAEIMEYLNVVVKSSALLMFMIISKILVMAAWFCHNYLIFGAHITLSIAFLFMALDCLVDEVCVVLLFKAFQSHYARLCGCTEDESLEDIDQVHGLHSCYTGCCAACVTCYSSKK